MFYKHNQKLEYKLKVNIDGEVKNIKATPQYFDEYTIYNLTGVVITIILPCFKHSFSTNLINDIYLISKIHNLCLSSQRDYEFFDSETGEIISPDQLNSGTIIREIEQEQIIFTDDNIAM